MMVEEQIFGGVAPARTTRAARPLLPAMLNGLRGRCPHCGEGRLFNGFLTVVDRCENCHEELYHHRADDLPAYLVVVVVGHILVGAFLSIETVTNLSTWQHLAIWIPLTIVSALALIRPVKGAVVGLQWALYMHGFGGEEDIADTHPEL